MSEPPAGLEAVTAFDIMGPLPTGTTLLEASAGTGKTYTAAGLVTRYVAEGVARLDELLVVTFGRAASQELRERVREALVRAERGLAGAADQLDHDDPVVARLLARPDRAETRRRLRDALAGFDGATIATTHQFCQLVLRSLGVAGDSDPGAQLVESLDELVDEVVDDLYLARYAGHARPVLGHDEARALGRLVVGDPHAMLGPDQLDEATPPGARVELARAVRAEVERRKRRLGLLSYDDLLSRLAEALRGAEAAARQRMRTRWRVVLVDEFQDTDPVQWQVIDRAFTGHATVVLIGDPKQAIYAFRGGDVAAYLQAARGASTRATLAANYRSDPELVASLQAVLAGAELGDPAIRVHPVAAALPTGRLAVPAGAHPAAPWRVRVLERERHTEALDDEGLLPVGAARQLIAADCAADIARLLASGATWCGQPLAAHQVAVLVHERGPAPAVQAALAASGIHAVIAGGDDILRTPAADAWVTLLTALEQPHRSGLVRAAALTPFLGLDLAHLDQGGRERTDRLADQLRGWAVLWRGAGGLAAVLEAAEQHGLGPRVLGQVGGERLLTDLRHAGQLLHETAVRDRLGPAALLGWLHTTREAERSGAERTRRLDSDAAAVQILTIHASKGLQFPVVYLPFEFECFVRSDPLAVRFHDSEGQRHLDVSGSGRAWGQHVLQGRAEEAGERLRMLYVALTRAQSQVVCWWAGTRNTAAAGLHRLLLGRADGTAAVPDLAPVRHDHEVIRTLRGLQARGGPACEPARPGSDPLSPVPAAPVGLGVRALRRSIDTEWRRTSYSGLIRIEELQPAGVSSEPEPDAIDDEPPDDPAEPPAAGADPTGPGALPGPDRAPDPVSPMAALPAGAAFGSLVHAVLEQVDPSEPDLLGQLRRHTAEQSLWWPVPVSPDELAAALVPMQHTPLGPLAGDVCLAQVPLRDRLCELDFEFPLSGGDLAAPASAPAAAGRTWGQVRLGDLAPLLQGHLPTDDPLLRYAARLQSPALGGQLLRGYLSGSIDALLRVPWPTGSGPEQRFLVVDYKTNLLGDPTRPTTALDYTHERLAEAMLHSHYPLQALLYSVVAQRFLRWRVPGYDPERHWGGVLYLFVRGMCGADTPTPGGHPTGVFGWRPPVALVLALSDLLDGALPAGVAQDAGLGETGDKAGAEAREEGGVSRG